MSAITRLFCLLVLIQSPEEFAYRPMESWVGQRFVFLPRPKASLAGTYEDFVGPVVCRRYAGRVAKVVAVSEFSGRAHLEFQMEDDGEKLRARTLPHKQSVKGIAPVDDLEKARAAWVGRTVWCREMLLQTYDAEGDATGFVKVKKYAPVKVVEVLPGWDEEKPARFVLETAAGQRGFLDVNLSGTNVPKELRHLYRFEHRFLSADPRLTHKWPLRVWAAIENNQVLTGMTAEQVRLSWGEPNQVNGEEWVYDGGVLRFKQGVLVQIK